nr:acyltransferase [Acinetobacter oleivorans]
MINNLREQAKINILDINTDVSEYIDATSMIEASINRGNKVYTKDLESLKYIKKISFSNSSTNSCIFIGKNLKGSTSITIEQKNNVVYIGDDCNLRNVNIVTQTLGAAILIGSRVSVAGYNRWLSGAFPGSPNSSIIIGDDCLLSSDITIRGSDGHPIMDFELNNQLNCPSDYVIIEPYVWIGQNVSITKSVRIGACSIIGMSSVVTRSIPRFSKAYGSPARFHQATGIWTKDRKYESIDRAKYYIEKFKQ